MSIDSDDGFVVARTAEAVDRLAELHRQATAALSQALKRYIKERIEPSEAERQNFHYPQLRIGYRCQGEVPSTTRASRSRCRANTASPSPTPTPSASTCWNSCVR